jgi:hypothetical protein
MLLFFLLVLFVFSSGTVCFVLRYLFGLAVWRAGRGGGAAGPHDRKMLFFISIYIQR